MRERPVEELEDDAMNQPPEVGVSINRAAELMKVREDYRRCLKRLGFNIRKS